MYNRCRVVQNKNYFFVKYRHGNNLLQGHLKLRQTITKCKWCTTYQKYTIICGNINNCCICNIVYSYFCCVCNNVAPMVTWRRRYTLTVRMRRTGRTSHAGRAREAKGTVFTLAMWAETRAGTPTLSTVSGSRQGPWAEAATFTCSWTANWSSGCFFCSLLC